MYYSKIVALRSETRDNSFLSDSYWKGYEVYSNPFHALHIKEIRRRIECFPFRKLKKVLLFLDKAIGVEISEGITVRFSTRYKEYLSW
ncbi:hypothetical protein CH373_01575 [Leptospira perolatii]|uniref:Uncharacterized protein n=1 Tax=Leptospira perolatii TaxID=2023191 RepID=A0A2M9ZRS3_9LEPT|nr:hypothetical protein CH360_01575 [Leptospira perolatii]PJZ74762.1 hypothetical protein CH373_01575 [Leptospira perolatii]